MHDPSDPNDLPDSNDPNDLSDHNDLNDLHYLSDPNDLNDANDLNYLNDPNDLNDLNDPNDPNVPSDPNDLPMLLSPPQMVSSWHGDLWEPQDGALACLLLSGHPGTTSLAQPKPGAPSGEQHGLGGLQGWEKWGSEVRRWLDVWTDRQDRPMGREPVVGKDGRREPWGYV